MYRIIYITAISCVLLLSQNIFAQQIISGKVLTNTNEPLPNANIVIANSTLGAASDKDGNYSIGKVKKGEYTIHVSFSGYQTIEQIVTVADKDVNLDFIMEETSIDLNAVVVTGTRTEKSLANTPVLTQMISIKDLQNKDAVDITQALEYEIPGLEFSSTATGKSLTLQGIEPQYMLFLVDGERLAGDTCIGWCGECNYQNPNEKIQCRRFSPFFKFQHPELSV
jgi:outer membrane receptor for ferrienterochelin and colicins